MRDRHQPLSHHTQHNHFVPRGYNRDHIIHSLLRSKMDASMGDTAPILPTQTTDSIKATMMSSSPSGPERTTCSRPFKELSLANIPSTTMPMETTLSVEKSISSSSDLQQDAENTPPPQTDIGVPNSSNPLQGDVGTYPRNVFMGPLVPIFHSFFFHSLTPRCYFHTEQS